MVKINDNYLKLPGSYLFSTIGKKVREYQALHPDKKVISLGIGDVTQPIIPEVTNALFLAVDEMGYEGSFRGYAPDLGYAFLREKIAENDYRTGVVGFRPMRSLSLTGPSATAAIFRRSSASIIK